jgi:hypothetical protein
MKPAIALPRVLGSAYMSAYIPPTTEMGVLAPIPASRRMMIKPDHEGARAQPRVKLEYRMNVETITTLRPYCSDNGEKTSGARTYPIK